MEWTKTQEKLPEGEKAQYMVVRRYDWERPSLGTKGYYHEIEILVFNALDECWDQEDFDDYACDINQVTHWMPLPEKPKQ